MWPWLVALYRKTPKSNKFMCGSSLISPLILITAAHCIKQNSNAVPLRAKDIEVHIGRHDIENTDERDYIVSNIRRIIVHPDWLETTDASHDADLALLILENPVRYGFNIRPVCLWRGTNNIDAIVNRTGMVVGWGRQENRTTSNVPWMVEIPVIADSTCLRADSAFSQITSERTFCGHTNDGSGPCNGDSGGGFYMRVGQQWELRGIVAASLANPNDSAVCFLKKPAVYADVAKFIDWIDTNVRYYSRL
jgi:secreted trypsin-like serine protease